MPETLPLFATAPRGVNDLLAKELAEFGATELRESPAGVSFRGTLETAYRACLWSRLANRILLQLSTFEVTDADALYEAVRALPWEEHLECGGTLAVSATQQRGVITHTRFLAQRVKDGVVDRFRARTGSRPSVELRSPDLRLHLHLQRNRATLNIDLSGESLHRRGYRLEGAKAPLKENLAAAILLRAGWPAIAVRGGALVDPLCGSGTLLIEGAMIAAGRAPGLLRTRYGFSGWLGHDAALWERLLEEARGAAARAIDTLPPLLGFDAEEGALAAALENARRAGFGEVIRFEQCRLDALPPRRFRGLEPGLVVTNPPYGERLGDRESLKPLYAGLGALLRDAFQGWRAAVFTGNPDLGKRMGLRARRRNRLYNGAIECQLLHFEVEPRWFVDRPPPGEPPEAVAEAMETPGARMFANRLRKNLKSLERWARQSSVRCYRVYDADMPEYNLAVDLYQGEGGRWVHVQEYEAPESVSRRGAEKRLAEALSVVPDVLGVAAGNVYLKVRRRQKGRAQYEKQAQEGRFHIVEEGGLRFAVNFTDYLDTGLFLDHRPTRALVRELARGRRFLNLFCYTGSATVYAAAGGAVATTSVDLSRTYLEWARRNLALNGFEGAEHRLVRADCLQWLAEARQRRRRYGLIFLDPPTFSASKRMTAALDIQRDHVALIRQASELLEPGGVLLFSNNFRRFRMDRDALSDLHVEDLTPATIPRDFARNPRIHNCWKISKS
ncbi:MAG: bifunctional 23S rRNA (guanine(2069)-N(7))-methyltransferase RlmK/23S rRNA (guanine(2445)-N(2))-methyltransferase RlmL [Gammaproteobacteria bacterium]